MKRSSDTRIRREVVGQMLDYAAHAAAFWPAERIRATFEAECEKRDRTPEAILADAFGPGFDEEGFWEQVKSHLEAGRLRLLFVADRIPPELRRVVEFLNRQMSPAEALAVEIRQFVGEDGRRSLVPRVLGLSAAASDKKEPSKVRSKPWSVEDVLARFRAIRPEVAEAGRRLVDWANGQGLRLVGGRGKKFATLHFYLDLGETELKPFYLYEDRRDGWLYLSYEYMGPTFAEPEARAELCARLSEIEDVELSPEKQYPCVGLSKLIDDDGWKKARDALDWMLGRMRSSPS